MKIALAIGHSRYIKGRRDGGALAADKKTNEWMFNSKVAQLIKKTLEVHGFVINIYDEYTGTTYTAAMRNLGQQIKKDQNDLAIELHFNYYDGIDDDIGQGHEWIYWPGSVNGKKLALALFEAEKIILPSVMPRSIIPRSFGRGAEFLKQTHCPSVVGEPFFGDDDWNKVGVASVAAVYVRGILDYFSSL